jgi:ABC-2 type transport system ATP-binding protein
VSLSEYLVDGPGPSVTAAEVAISIAHLSRRFGAVEALQDVSMTVGRGQIHALLGPNGAGKTTLLRILATLVAPEAGEISIFGVRLPEMREQAYKKLFGLIPSGDRSFYHRLSGLENLAFFGRMYGLSRREAVDRAWKALEQVNLQQAARRRTGLYSHGMYKRLSVARALMMDPPILLVDEATHDLDPEGVRTVQELVAKAAARGTAVVWTTQRIDEIRDFAHHVTLLHRGTVRFSGTVSELMATSSALTYLVHLRRRSPRSTGSVLLKAQRALGRKALVTSSQDSSEHFVLTLRDGVLLGTAFDALIRAGVEIVGCREKRSEIEEAFLALTEGAPE